VRGGVVAQKDFVHYPYRLIESGRFARRCDIQELVFEDDQKDRLKAIGRLEVAAWPEGQVPWFSRHGATKASSPSPTLVREAEHDAMRERGLHRGRRRGGHVVLKINGVTMCELDDRDPRRIPRGSLALQVHVGPPMLAQFKDIFLRKL
jgi:hypothetical protein